MTSPLEYILAARRCEIDELERLARTSELVSLIGRYTHALQRERGITNIFLATDSPEFANLRLLQVAECESLAAQVTSAFEELATGEHRVRNGARLFNRVAVALHAQQGLPELRGRIAARALTPRGSTAAYVRLIAGLLAVVFEAADSAGDPEISRVLVALFNFMQGKEFAGQERALGGAVFASGTIDAPTQREWHHLIEQQQHCLDASAEFSDADVLAAEEAGRDHRAIAQIERLRRKGLALGVAGHALPGSGTVREWYDWCTVRIDTMRTVEDLLTSRLRGLCERKIEEAQGALRDQQASMESLQRSARMAPSDAPRQFGPQLEHSVYEMVQEQSRRLQAMSDELETVRAALNERKVIERAKGLLMAHRQLSEDDAYKTLRQMAMNQKKRISDVADAVLAMAEVLPGPK